MTNVQTKFGLNRKSQWSKRNEVVPMDKLTLLFGWLPPFMFPILFALALALALAFALPFQRLQKVTIDLHSIPHTLGLVFVIFCPSIQGM
jgi:hypothetical protein